MPISFSRAYFIKLGQGGVWESECLSQGTLRFGNERTPHDLALNGDWEGVRQRMMEVANNRAGVASWHTTQIRAFYEAGEGAIFITFSGRLLRWCRPAQGVIRLQDGSLRRATINGWHSESSGGNSLTVERLAGHLLSVQGFRGTICAVHPPSLEYLENKLNDRLVPQAQEARAAEDRLLEAIKKLLQLLTWQDFELLVDLIFSTSGWRRVGVVGKTERTVDLDLSLPSTGERAFVQIKSRADQNTLLDYIARFNGATAYQHMFFVWHTGNIADVEDKRVVLIGPDKLAQLVLNAGLSSWLREKVS